MTDRIAQFIEPRLHGQLFRPGDAGYGPATAPWNGRFAAHPDLVVRAADTSDVQAAVRAARDADLAIAVRGNGHSYAGEWAIGSGLLLDLSEMRSVVVDPAARTATVQPGANWGLVDEATQEHGLATPGGTVASVGVAGVTLGGGEGWLGRAHGMTIDNLVAAEVVTADGRVVRADANEQADLFWALRGGGGNFGLVTSFTYRLHPVGPELFGGQVIYPADRAAHVLRAFRDFFADAPERAMGYAFFLRLPAGGDLPVEFHGSVALDLLLAYIGPPADGETALAALRSLGGAIVDTMGPMSYTRLQAATGGPVGNRWYTRGHYLDGLTDTAIDALVAGLEPFPGERTAVYLGPSGGAVGRVAPEATAFPHRNAAYGLHIWPGWTDPADDDAITTWARDLHAAMAPHANGGVYVNLLADDERDRVPAAYGSNYARLREVKRRWDPENVLRANHNIAPAE